MRRLFVLLSIIGCAEAPPAKPSVSPSGLEGRFLLQSVAQPTSTSPQLFPAEDWAGGLTLLERPSYITVRQGAISAEGVLALSGTITGEASGPRVQFMVAEDDGGTRLELQFQGTYDAAQERIEGDLVQRWELSGEEDAGGVTLTGRATFIRKTP